jgi:hypothetical protein
MQKSIFISFIAIILTACQTQPHKTLNTAENVESIVVKPCTGNDTAVCQEIPDSDTKDKVKKTYTDKNGCNITEYESGLAEGTCP